MDVIHVRQKPSASLFWCDGNLQQRGPLSPEDIREGPVSTFYVMYRLAQLYLQNACIFK